MVSITTKLSEQNNSVVIAQDINNSGAKRFIGLSSYRDIFPYVEAQDEKCFHEVMGGVKNRRLYFDFDMAITQGTYAPEMADFINNIRGFIIPSVESLFGASLAPDDIIFAESHRADKFSVHIHIPKFNTTLTNMKLLFSLVDRGMTAIGLAGLDRQVYKPNQTLRLLNCHKKGKGVALKLYTTSCRAEDTLVGFLDDSEELFLIPRIQKLVDERAAEDEERRVSSQISSSNPPEFYRQLCSGLAQKRADDFTYWIKVCMALGHENAGLATAIEFSRRSSKFDEYAVQKAYEKGSEFSGRPLTCGTLMAYLKEDNLPAFMELIGVEDNTTCADDIKDMRDKLAIDEEDSDDESSEEETPTVKTLRQEDKISRWLKAPEYFLKSPVDEPVEALSDEDEVVCYEARFMKEYPANKPTYAVKGQKGQGKTHQLVEYIKEHNPKRVVFVSFRRSFSKELLKRLAPLGFKDYRGITGGIKDDVERVIIQVESLNRLHWTQPADLVVFDEIESIRGQLFSPTVRFRAAVMEKYSMLMRTGLIVFAMDADLSGNTIQHIKKNRGGQITYIENEHKEIQEKFTEFYTTKMVNMQKELCAALDAGQKLVIPMNRSVKFMEALQGEIAKKYPEVKIQVYNSKTIRNKEVADELDDVAVSWKKYDVVMYSPTISAGVSFDEKHFDKCFCYFVNNGKINSMRQMICRVRHFSTNTYHYCLQAFGGSSKPTSVAAYEDYICSNRFLGDKPENVISEEDFDGTREYPYKNTGYYMWIYNEIEKNRDKNLFLFNFLREQYHSGVGQMRVMGADEPKVIVPKITQEHLEAATKKLNELEHLAISEADLIDDAMKKEIEVRMEKEQVITEAELLSLQRKNLLDCYDLDDFTEITAVFVEIFAPGKMRSAYRNRKLLGPNVAKGLKKLMKDEGSYFNNVFTDNVDTCDDLSKNYKSMKMAVAVELLKMAGFPTLYDKCEITTKKMMSGFKSNEALLIEKMPRISRILGKSERYTPKINTWGDKVYLKNMLAFINSILEDLFGLKIKQTANRSGKYKIDGIDLFKFETPLLFD